MKKITESQLIDRVAQLRAKVNEAGPLKPSPNELQLNPPASPSQGQYGGDQNPNNNLMFPSAVKPGERHADPSRTNSPSGNVKPFPVDPASTQTSPRIQPQGGIPGGVVDNAINNPLPPVTPPKQQGATAAQPAQDASGHWYDPITKFASNVGDDLSYAANHLGDIGQGVGKTAANMAQGVGDFVSGVYNGATSGGTPPKGQTAAQPKGGAKHGGKTGGHGGGHGGAGMNPKVAALQQDLNSKGAKLNVDGIWGPKTQEAYDSIYNNHSKIEQDYAAANQKSADEYVAQMKKLGTDPAVIAQKVHQVFPNAKVNADTTTPPVTAGSTQPVANQAAAAITPNFQSLQPAPAAAPAATPAPAAAPAANEPPQKSSEVQVFKESDELSRILKLARL
jgi:hypothetical protein